VNYPGRYLLANVGWFVKVISREGWQVTVEGLRENVDNERRLTELEGKLSGTQRALAWLKKQQEKGGFIDLVCRGLEPGGYIERIRQGPQSEVIDRFIINDEDSAFVFDCVGVCNDHALELAQFGDEVALRTLYLRRLLHGIDIPEESDLQRFRSILKNFALDV